KNIFFLLMISTLMACTDENNDPPAEKIALSELEQKLHICEQHFQNHHLIAGLKGTALSCYRDVLTIDDKNVQALAGLDKIEAHYVSLTQVALRLGQSKVAQHPLKTLRTLNPNSPHLSTLEKDLARVIADRFQPGKVIRNHLKDKTLGPEMVWIAGGRFQMGDIQGGGYSDEQPVHDVVIKPFAMGKYEVTNAEFVHFLNTVKHRGTLEEPWFETVVEDSDSYIKGTVGNFKVEIGYEHHPMIEVSWYGATAYAKWLSEETGKLYRLPTEAEWEYAARARTNTQYWWGNHLGSNQANCNEECGDRFGSAAPVGSFKPNPFGLHDTVANVWEWTCSKYQVKYGGAEQQCFDQTGLRVIRGGAWNIGDVRTADRSRNAQTTCYVNVGFRVLREHR
ncbi:MAG: formylglycine-generating enzyme family protein, partial [Thiomargarita sp.]|nr:formylglycine-generating enzyme family protein [Thiomargarita sp.]